MSWVDEKASINNDLNRLKNTITLNLNYLKGDNINNIVNNTTNANNRRDEAIQLANSALTDLAVIDTTLQSRIKTTLDSQASMVAQTATLGTETQTADSELQKTRELDVIRKEQAKSLQTKYDGNLHSSWMGLWVPLSDEFRAVLITTVIAMFAGIVVLMFFLIQGGYVSLRRPVLAGGWFQKARM